MKNSYSNIFPFTKKILNKTIKVLKAFQQKRYMGLQVMRIPNYQLQEFLNLKGGLD